MLVLFIHLWRLTCFDFLQATFWHSLLSASAAVYASHIIILLCRRPWPRFSIPLSWLPRKYFEDIALVQEFTSSVAASRFYTYAKSQEYRLFSRTNFRQSRTGLPHSPFPVRDAQEYVAPQSDSSSARSYLLVFHRYRRPFDTIGRLWLKLLGFYFLLRRNPSTFQLCALVGDQFLADYHSPCFRYRICGAEIVYMLLIAPLDSP